MYARSKIMSNTQECGKEEFTPEDLIYLKIAIAIFQSNLSIKEEMPNSWAAMEILREKVNRIYDWMVSAEK
jgi:hypothetical protein